MDTFIPLLFAALLGVGAVLCLWTALRWRRALHGFRPENELRVYGTLTHAERSPKYRNPRLGIRTPTDLHEFTYTYEVDGRTYTVTDRLVQNGAHIPGGTEIICQRSDPRQCYIPGLTKPPAEEAHHTLYFAAVFCTLWMLYFLSTLH